MRTAFIAVVNYLRKIDVLLWLFVLIATGFGLVLVASSTRVLSSDRVIITQTVASILGIVCAICLTLVDYEEITRLWPVIVSVSIILILLTFVMGVTSETSENDTTRSWLMLPGGTSFQPAEFAKISFIISFSTHMFSVVRQNALKSLPQILLLGLHALFPMMLVQIQGDSGTAMVYLFICVAILWGCGIQKRYMGILGLIVLIALPLLYFYVFEGYQLARVQTVLDPSMDPLGAGFQQGQAEISIGSGGIWGRGLFQGPRMEKRAVPESWNDFIFSLAGEELGFVGCIAVMLVYSLIMIRVLRVAALARDTLGQGICYGVFGWLLLHFVQNIGMCIYLLPVAGIPLPFFSQGGTSAMAVFLGIGLVQNVYMRQKANPYKDALRRYKPLKLENRS